MTVRPVRPLQQKRGWAFSLAVPIIKPTLLATTKRTWIDGEKIPATGGCILVFNHVSHIDPLTAAHIVYDHGRMPRYLAKSGLFKNPALSYFLQAAGQIPVERLSRNAKGAFDAAVAAVRAGECVVVYPEGTLTRDPGLWPMVGKTGIARVALLTKAPVIPVAQWGAHEVVPPYAKEKKVRLLPRKTLRVLAGPPVDLTEFYGQEPTPEVLRQITETIMLRVTEQLAELRGEPAPAALYNPRAAREGK